MKPLFPRICLVRYQGNPSIHIYITFLYLFNNRVIVVSSVLSLHVKVI